MSIVEAKTKEEFTTYLKKYNKCIVDFYAEWCQPCNKLSDKLNKITEELKDINIIKVNVNDLDDIACKYNVTTIPHIMFYNNGKLEKQYLNTSEYTDIIKFAHNIYK
jgi:thioredoxin 1